MRTLVFAAAIALLLLSQPTHATEPTVRDNLNGVVRILFLGDSITHAGKYVAYVETYTRLREPKLATGLGDAPVLRDPPEVKEVLIV